jgi:hypothetical protein
MPEHPREFWIGPPLGPDINAARLAAEQAVRHSPILEDSLQRQEAERVTRWMTSESASREREIAAIEASLARSPIRQQLLEFERQAAELSAQRSKEIAVWERRAAEAFTAGSRIDAALAARQAAMVNAAAAHARQFRLGQQPFEFRLWREPSTKYEVQEQSSSPLVIVTWGGRRQGAGAKRGDRIAETRALIEKALLIRHAGAKLTRWALRSQVGRLNVVNIRHIKALDNMIKRCHEAGFSWLTLAWLRDAPLSDLRAKLDSLGH